jgi:integrase
LRRTTLAITHVRIRDYRYFCVTCPRLGGGRTRRFFRDKREAQTYLEQCRIQQQNYGTAALSISDSLRIEALECSEKLYAFNKTLRDATNFYVVHLRTISGSRKTSEVVSELLKARAGDGLSARYLADLRVRLARFNDVFGEKMIAAITPSEIDTWLRSLDLSSVTRNTFRRRLAVLFSFAARRGYLAVNPIDNVDRAKEYSGEIEILTVTETTRLLECASFETLPYWAIGAFAGLRRAEIERLEWSEIDFDGGFIEVKAAKAKTASRRLVPIQHNLRTWLEPYRIHGGYVCPQNLQKKINDDRDHARLRLNWPQNALRHSFGSYHLACFNDAARLALEMGNSPAMIFKHYRQLVKPKQAERYWKIAPAARGKKVIQFKATE